MRKQCFIRNSAGIEFLVRVIGRGGRYGVFNTLIHDDAEPFVEFYDTRYPFHTDASGKMLGQFVSRYDISTLYGRETGLNLCGGNPDWVIDRRNQLEINQFLSPFEPLRFSRACI